MTTDVHFCPDIDFHLATAGLNEFQVLEQVVVGSESTPLLDGDDPINDDDDDDDGDHEDHVGGDDDDDDDDDDGGGGGSGGGGGGGGGGGDDSAWFEQYMLELE